MKTVGGTLIETFEDRNVTAAVCRTVPNGVSDLGARIEQCTSTTEQDRKQNFATNTLHLQQDIQALRASVGDSIAMGDSIFGQIGHTDIYNQVNDRNRELKKKYAELEKDIQNKERIVDRSNRDFTDVKDTLPEKLPTNLLHVIEDYTLAFLCVTFLFMSVAIIIVYTIQDPTSKIKAFFQSAAGCAILGAVLYAILYFLS